MEAYVPVLVFAKSGELEGTLGAEMLGLGGMDIRVIGC